MRLRDNCTSRNPWRTTSDHPDGGLLLLFCFRGVISVLLGGFLLGGFLLGGILLVGFFFGAIVDA